jgi:hypothetical protein
MGGVLEIREYRSVPLGEKIIREKRKTGYNCGIK